MELLPDDRLALPHLADNFSGNWQYSYGLPQEKLQHRYADGRRNIKEILVRVVDSERIFAYRHYALCGTDIKR